VPGLTNAAFQAFFGPSLGAPSGTSYGWLVTDVNNSGVAIGHVMFPLGGGLGDTSFVFDNNQVVCCTADFPFLLNDINDNGFVVGQNPAGLLFGFVADCCSLLSAQTPLAMTFTTPQPELFRNFMGIDDSNNISALGFSGQRYDLFSSPEPGSIVLLAGALFVGALILRRRQIRPLAAETRADPGTNRDCRCGHRPDRTVPDRSQESALSDLVQDGSFHHHRGRNLQEHGVNLLLVCRATPFDRRVVPA